MSRLKWKPTKRHFLTKITFRTFWIYISLQKENKKPFKNLYPKWSYELSMFAISPAYNGTRKFQAPISRNWPDRQLVGFRVSWFKYEKSWDGLPSSPKSKRGEKTFGKLPKSSPPFLMNLGVFRRQMCPVTRDPVDNCVRVVYRPHACVTIIGSGIQGVANAATVNSTSFFLDEKGLVRLFPATFVMNRFSLAGSW